MNNVLKTIACKRVSLYVCFFFLLTGWLAPVRSQSITNVRANQTEDDKIVVTYDLLNESEQTFDVSLLLSSDRGRNFDISPHTAIGDVGRKVRPGKGKRITWDVLMDLPRLRGDDFVFRVKATPMNVAKGKELLAKVVNALGGKEELMALKSFKISYEGLIISHGERMNVTSLQLVIYPDKYRHEIKWPFGKTVSVVNGNRCWVRGPQGDIKLSSDQKKEMQKTLKRDPILLLRMAGANSNIIQYLGEESTSGDYEILMIGNEKDIGVKLFLNPESYLIEKVVYETIVMGKRGINEVVYSDYRNISGFKLPFKLNGFLNGQKWMEFKVKDVKHNIAIQPSMFEKP